MSKKEVQNVLKSRSGWVSLKDLSHIKGYEKSLEDLYSTGEAVPFGKTHAHDTSFLHEAVRTTLVSVRDGNHYSADISSDTGKAQKTVNTHLAKLASMGFIVREQNPSTGAMRNSYTIPEHYAPKRDHKEDLQKVFAPKKKANKKPVESAFMVSVDDDATPLGLVQVIELLTQELKLAHEEIERLKA